MLSVVDGPLAPVPWEQLDPILVQETQDENRGYTLDVLKTPPSPCDAPTTPRSHGPGDHHRTVVERCL